MANRRDIGSPLGWHDSQLNTSLPPALQLLGMSSPGTQRPVCVLRFQKELSVPNRMKRHPHQAPNQPKNFISHECVCAVEVWWGLGLSSGSALGELQDVHLAAGHGAHYHSRTWSHQRTEKRANILLKCHCQQACERTRRHRHKRQTAHTSPH
ncbi:unnamed protein product [Pleuronectes platessa]|uniref:Uncharacterized protein n=1 Tax=Pleuronectes platessa TaxID=8262 RepID=A0A9N7W306_PLEPL|nr:unnamed protein product [Pleuronectes platessa]